MGLFAETPRTLLRRLSEYAAGEGEAEWARFAELYEPAIREFIRLTEPTMPEADVDDLKQEVFLRVIQALRAGAYDPDRAKFRTWLSAVIRRMMIDRYRERSVRRATETISIEATDYEPVSETLDAATLADMKWRLARHHAAVEHVFAKSALSQQSRKVYLMSEVEGLAPKEIASRLGLAANAVRRIKSRVEAMISAVEAQYE